MHEGFWAQDAHGGATFIYYDDLDIDQLGQVFKPIGGFCYPVEGFVRMPLPEAPYYVKSWLPKQGKCMIYGAAKAGKSYLALQLARCVGAGEPFLGIPTQQGRVLYLQFELGMEVLQGRIKSTGRTYEDVYVGTTFGLKLDTRMGREHLHNALEAVQPAVLILDPFYKILTGDENESHDVKSLLDNLDEAIEVFRCSVVMMHHAGKDIERGQRGTSTLADWHDAVIELRKISKVGEPFRIKLTPKFLRHAELPDKPIEAVMKNFEFDIDTGGLTLEEQILRALKPRGKTMITIKELLDLNLCSARSSLYDALNRLVAQGQVERIDRGVYHLKNE